MKNILILTAVEKERKAVQDGIGTDPSWQTALCGFGPVEAAVRTAVLLGTNKPDIVINAGVAGGFAGRSSIGDTVLGSESILADLGAESPDGFINAEDLGFGKNTWHTNIAESVLPAFPAETTHVGQILTVSTATGTDSGERNLRIRYPEAFAEAMEGAGVASAADAAGIPYLELRTISNKVGPRDLGGWELSRALTALTDSLRLLKEALK
ncbi:futalosine hydrolase [Alkalicoccus saliphilus]|jgi:futalosine hydrolase|uniref:Futalosine hydrolase n=1 Tax=Alkalicoccus saliphilus TaxID=200989 RepID=A0A2T4U9I0_9BACI|nr:futalosine hydrolase [Alkalicoccus saliphilus]PTL40051.1 futalosine hydrolase [Alkalicoccus saliphilus]